MSKHATTPFPSKRVNSHACGIKSPVGNWNRHKKRRKLDSSIRTLGRQARFFCRHPEVATPEQYDWAAKQRGGNEPWAFWDEELMELIGTKT